ncbi:hypothetical protein FRB99_006387 [Tulasnella sp. 403]|nr:hypothetical protein FRB99_006387 [Tulasnella sp. 403]
MESLFGRKKDRDRTRPRQSSLTNADLSSIPYNQTAPPSKPPTPVASLSQSLRQSGGSTISAPITNPTLTSNGTELNKFTRPRHYSNDRMDMSTPEHYRGSAYSGYSTSSSLSPGSPQKGNASWMSNTTLDPSTSSTTLASSRTSARGEFSSATSMMSSIVPSRSSRTEPGSYPSSVVSSPRMGLVPPPRPPSSVTMRNDTNRVSAYAPSTTSTASDSQSHHSHSHPHLHRLFHRHDEEFYAQKPSPEEIEALFNQVLEERVVGDLNSNLDLDMKWKLVVQHMRYGQDRAHSHKGHGSSPVSVPEKNTPEWYLKKFIDHTITAKEVSGLGVSLRTMPVDWARDFLDSQGISVLAQALHSINRKGSHRREADEHLEYEIIKCLRALVNLQSKLVESITVHSNTIVYIACSLNSPNVSTRKVASEILIWWTHYAEVTREYVLLGLDGVSSANNETGRYAYWLKSFEAMLDGRGKMGSLVGASTEVKKSAGTDPSLNDYALVTIALINLLLRGFEDLELRVHNRSEMEKAGLLRIVEKCKQFGTQSINKHLEDFERLAEEDRLQLVKNYNEAYLKDMSNPYDVYRALISSVEGTPAYAFLLSAMQHLLLIREDPETRSRYFQLVDELVTSVVLDKKPGFKGGLSDTIGVSVARLVAQFGEQDRAQKAEDDTAMARAQITQLQLEKEYLEEQVALGQEGLVGELKAKLASTEKQLRVSRQNCDTLSGRVEEQEREFQEKISQLEAQIGELFRMFKEANVYDIMRTNDRGDTTKNEEVITAIQKQMERKKAFGILEGRTPRKSRRGLDGGFLGETLEEEHEPDDEDGSIESAEVHDLARTPQPRRTTKARIHRAGGVGQNGFGHVNGTGSPGRPSTYADGDEDEDGLYESGTANGTGNIGGGLRPSGSLREGNGSDSEASRRTATSRFHTPEKGDGRGSTALRPPGFLSDARERGTRTEDGDTESEYAVSRGSVFTAGSNDTHATSISSLSDIPHPSTAAGSGSGMGGSTTMGAEGDQPVTPQKQVTPKKLVRVRSTHVSGTFSEQLATKMAAMGRTIAPVQELFLSELKPVLPSPEQVGKLNVYRNSSEEELQVLHPSDRLMVQLIKINRLAPRLDGMLYKVMFEEQASLLEEGAKKLHEAGEALMNAENFKEVMRLILLIGNYMNGTGVKGGAFGFKVSSINKLVDTKSVNNTTLLHFLERTVHKEFPNMGAFLDELAKPAEAYRINLIDIRKGLTELRTGLKSIRTELEEHFTNLDVKTADDHFGKKMWRFLGEATDRLADLVDDVTLADTTFTEVLRHYGEDEKNMQSSEFFGIFKTFVTSYKKCQAENQALEDERMALIKRQQYAEELKAARAQAASQAAPEESADTTVLDTLLEKLRNGDTVTRKKRRAPGSRLPPSPDAASATVDGAAMKAQDMLAALKQNMAAPSPPRPERGHSGRKARLRASALSISSSAADLAEEVQSPGSATRTRHSMTEEIPEEVGMLGGGEDAGRGSPT